MSESQSIPWKRVGVEAIAIVGSILLAFGIQAWWDERNESEREFRHLTALLAEFEQNDALLQEAREVYEQYYLIAIEALELLDQESAVIGDQEFEQMLIGLVARRTFHLDSGAYDGLIASGELGLIRDETLRNRLAAWPSYVAEWAEEEEAVFSHAYEIFSPFLSESVRLRNGIARRLAVQIDGLPVGIPASPSGTLSFHELIGSLEFDNHVYQRALGARWAIHDGDTLRAQVQSIVELIRQSLDK